MPVFVFYHRRVLHGQCLVLLCVVLKALFEWVHSIHILWFVRSVRVALRSARSPVSPAVECGNDQSMGVCFRPFFGGCSGCFPFCAVVNKAVGTVPVPVSWRVSVQVPVALTDQELASFFVKGQIVNTSGVVTACCLSHPLCSATAAWKQARAGTEAKHVAVF